MPMNKVVKLDVESRPASAGPILAHIHTFAGEFLARLLRHMLDNADDTLFSLADKAQSDQRQNAYFDAMRALRITRGDIEAGFNERYRYHVETFLTENDTGQTTSAAPDGGSTLADGLSLVDEQDLEASLALTGMVDKARNRLARELYAIERRYQAVLDRPDLGIDEIPIGPRMICQAFDRPMQTLSLEIEIQLIVYKLFDRDVMTHLTLLYDKVNAHFIGSGVLPVLRMAVASGRAEEDDIEAPPPPLPDEIVRGLDQDPANVEAASAGAFTALRALLQQAGPTVGVSPTGPAATVTATDNSALIEIVAGLQRLDMASSTVILREKVDDLEAHGELRQIDRDVICIVEMLFDYILEDPAVPADVRAQIGRLQIPLIRLALDDSQVFEDRQHPARRLINRMAHASVGIDESAEGPSPLLGRIEQIVDTICTRFDGRDIGIFTTLLDEFEDFLETQTPAVDEAEQQRLEARERHALSEAWVGNTIAALIDGHCLPRPVFDIIEGPWKQVMLRAYLDGGEQATAWKEAQRFVEILIESVEPHSGGFDAQRLVRIIPEIVRTLRNELDAIDYPHDEAEALLKGLETVHLAALRGHSDEVIDGVEVHVAPDPTQTVDMDAVFADLEGLDLFADEEGDTGDDGEVKDTTSLMRELFGGDVEEIVISSGAEPIAAEVEDEAWSTVLGLEAGQWLSIDDEEGRGQRMKLVWKSELTGECTFANWRGRITEELGFNDLARRLRSGQARVLDGLPIFERAFDAVMNSLRNHDRDAAGART